jgi:hypothetical protein
LARRQIRYMTQWMLVCIGAIDRAGKQLAAEIRHWTPPEARRR